MSDVDTAASVQASLEADIEAAFIASETSEVVNSDTMADEVKPESAVVEETEPTSEEAAEPEEGDAVLPEEPKFDFRETPTSVQNLVTKLSHMSETERQETISKLTRSKEIEAVKKAYPDYFQTEAPISRKDIEAINEKLARLEKLEQLESTTKLLESVQSAQPQLEEALRNRMLKEQFGESYKDVLVDPKFIASYDKYATLQLEDKLEIACNMSPIARKLAIGDEVAKEVRTRAAKMPAKGKQVTQKQEVSAQELLTPAGMAKALGFEY